MASKTYGRISDNIPSMGIVATMRLSWRAGGGWERFFVLAPFIWGAYIILLFLLVLLDPRLYEDPQLTYVYWMIFSLIVTHLVLLAAWNGPLVAHSGILRTVAQTEEFQEEYRRHEREVRNLINYLDSLGHGGRWPLGVALSFVYFLVFVAWGLVALNFSALTGLENGPLNFLLFLGVHVTSVLAMGGLYVRAQERMVRDAAQKGYPFLRSTPV